MIVVVVEKSSGVGKKSIEGDHLALTPCIGLTGIVRKSTGLYG